MYVYRARFDLFIPHWLASASRLSDCERQPISGVGGIDPKARKRDRRARKGGAAANGTVNFAQKMQSAITELEGEFGSSREPSRDGSTSNPTTTGGGGGGSNDAARASVPVGVSDSLHPYFL